MHNLFICTLLYIQLHAVAAHYLFAHLLVNGTLTDEFQYVRNVTGNDTKDDPKFEMAVPQYGNELYTTNFTCGRDAFLSAPTTNTASIIAGSQVGFRIASIPNITNEVRKEWKNRIFHEGPANVYMAKAPSNDLSTFTGYDGDWFRIAEFNRDAGGWWLVGPVGNHVFRSEINFTIPSTTPSGSYLLRLEQYPFAPYLQFYVNCAHINVIGPGGGTPTNFARFPGEYNYTKIKQGDGKNFKNFTGLGPPLWLG